MTIDKLIRTPIYTVGGVGPFAIADPYQAASDILAEVVLDGKRTRLPATEYSVEPASSETTGALTLSAAAAATYLGAKLYIRRSTALEQGWAGQTARELGLEGQLDALTMATQDLSAAGGVAATLVSATFEGAAIVDPLPVQFPNASDEIAGVYVDGLRLAPTAYVSTGAEISPVAGWPAGAQLIEVVFVSPVAAEFDVVTITTIDGGTY